MPFVTSVEDALAARKPLQVLGQTYHLSPYVGSVPVVGRYQPGNEANDDGMPQGFLVEQPPGSVTPPHFHDHEQFQVVVRGGGHMGKKAALPLSVHYAGGHTPYGPIVAGDEGLVYFTLRSRWDAGAKYMPGARNRLKPVRRRHRLAAGIPLPDSGELRKTGATDRDPVLEPAEDGTCAYLYRIGPAGTAALETSVEAGGHYAIVVAGSVIDGERMLPCLSGLYRYRDEAPLTVTAGPDGAAVLLMQFSSQDPA